MKNVQEIHDELAEKATKFLKKKYKIEFNLIRATSSLEFPKWKDKYLVAKKVLYTNEPSAYLDNGEVKQNPDCTIYIFKIGKRIIPILRTCPRPAAASLIGYFCGSSGRTDDTMWYYLADGYDKQYNKLFKYLYRKSPKKEIKNKIYMVDEAGFNSTDNIGRLDHVILPEAVKQEVVNSIDHFYREGYKVYKEFSLPAFKKILLYGEPGCGKTLLLKGLASYFSKEYNVNVCYITGAHSGTVNQIFNKFSKWMEGSKYPLLFLLEDIDRLINGNQEQQLLNLLDGIDTPPFNSPVVALFTTNYPSMLEKAFARYGRIDGKILIPNIIDKEDAINLCNYYYEPLVVVANSLVGKNRVFVRELAMRTKMYQAKEKWDADFAVKYTLQNMLDEEKDSQSFDGVRKSIGFQNQNGD